MKEYIINNDVDFNKFCDTINKYFVLLKLNNKKIKPFKLISKELKQQRSCEQLRYYWVCINEAAKAFKKEGHTYTKLQIHEFIKKQAGYTRTDILKNGKVVEVVLSIADNSDDATVKELIDLTDFLKMWVAENLGYVIRN
jgi:hypothetical protein